MSGKELSRRSFLKGAAASALTLAAGAAVGTQALAEEAAQLPAWAPVKWDYEADVVICGCGVTGAMAAREAIRQGHSCLILEKATKEMAGGASACFGGYYVPYPAQALLYSSNGALNEEQANTIVAQMTDDFTWMMYNGMQVNDFYKVIGAGLGFYTVLETALAGIEAPILYETPVTGLIQNPESKEVFGVTAKDASGSTLHIKANKGVLLATGSPVEGNALLGRFFLPNGVKIANCSSPANTGDGLMLGMKAGAALHNMAQHGMELTHYALKKASDELGTAIVTYATGENRGARIFVNQSGQRFTNEEIYMPHYKGTLDFLQFPGNAEAGYQGFVNMPGYLIIDSQIFDTEGLGCFLSDYGWAYSKGVYTWSADNKAELQKGWIAKGETIEELVENLAVLSGHGAIDAEALKATIEAYNQGCEAGADAFGRSVLQPLGKGPYYAAELTPTIMYTIGGLVCSPIGETLDWDGKPIPRLYSAGDIGQPCEISPLGACGCGAMGALAVRQMLTLENAVLGDAAANVIPAPSQAAATIAAAGLYAAMQAAQSDQGQAVSAYVSDEVYKDGVYTGVGNSVIGGDIKVSVTVSGGKVASIHVDSHNETASIGGTAFESLAQQAVASNSAQIDGLSGATETAKGFAAAVADALSKAK